MPEARWRAEQLRLHLVTDRALCGPRGVLAVAEAAVRGGATCVQLREKSLDTRAFVEAARALKALLAPLGVPLIVNDRLDVALACAADGVHVGQTDMPVDEVRRWMPDALIGLSIETLEQLRAAEREPVDYYGASPVYATSTKPDAAPALGLDGLRALRALTQRPLVAIGGIDAGNAAAVRAAGADGIAVVSALCAANDPEQAARRLRRAMKRHIVLSGLPASGKSEAARQLAAALGLPCYDKDDFLEALFEAQGCTDAATRERLSREADAQMRASVERAADGAVIASWWRHPQSSALTGTPSDWLLALGGALLEVHCRCAPATAAARFAVRKRHPGHLDARRESAARLASFEAHAAHGPLGLPNSVEIDTEQRGDPRAAVERALAEADTHPRCAMRAALDGDLPERASTGLRRPRPGDVEALAVLILRAYRGSVDDEGETEDDALAEIRSVYAGERGRFRPECSSVVDHDGRLVAATLITQWEGRPLVSYSFTDPDQRSRGHARAGLAEAMHLLRAAGEAELRLYVTLANERAVRLYRRIGFRFVRA